MKKALILLALTVTLNNGQVDTYEQPVQIIRSDIFYRVDGEKLLMMRDRRSEGFGLNSVGEAGWVFRQKVQYDMVVDGDNHIQGIYPVGTVKEAVYS